MAIVSIENVGRMGVVVDDQPHNLPPEAWTDAKNVRFADNAVSKIQGQESFAAVATVLTNPVYKNTIIPVGVQDFEYPVVNKLNEDGTLLLIGAPWRTVNGLTQAWQVYLYDIDSEGLHTNPRAILPSTSIAGANFGTVVDMSDDGSVIVVGARLEDISGNAHRGAVYVYTLTNGVVTLATTLLGTVQAELHYGTSVGLSGDGTRMIIGAPREIGSGTIKGSFYIYESTGGAAFWALKRQFIAASATVARTGIQVAMNKDGDVVAVGQRTATANYNGEVMIFKRSGGGVWDSLPDHTIAPSDRADPIWGDDFFGTAADGSTEWEGISLAFSGNGDVLVVGSKGAPTSDGIYDYFVSGTESWLTNGTATIANVGAALEVTYSSDGSNHVYKQLTGLSATSSYKISFVYTEGNAPTKDMVLVVGTTLGAADIFTTTITTSSPSANFAIPVSATTIYVGFYLSGGLTGENFALDNIIFGAVRGKAYVFKDTAGTYVESQILVPTFPLADATAPMLTGWSLAIDDLAGYILLGSSLYYDKNDPLESISQGAATLWISTAGVFAETKLLIGQDPTHQGFFSYKMSISGDGIKFVIGDTHDGDGRSRTEVYVGTADTVPNPPHWLLPWKTLTENLWLYPGITKIYKTNGTTHSDITRYTTVLGDNPYNASARPIWTGGVLHGVPVMNHSNLTDFPQQWDTTLSRMKDLDNWPAATYCTVIRTFKNFLVALDITKGAVRYPFMVKWSHPADPGSVPSTWDITDATKLAGEATLAQSNGWLIDCAPLGDLNVIYKQDSIWGMQFIGGVNVFRFFEISSSIGAIAARCIQPFYKKHLVVGRSDIVLLDGNIPRSIVNKRMRSWFFNNLHPDWISKTVVALNPPKQEVWICFVETGSTSEYLTKALVWNWDQNTWSVKDLPNLSFLAYGNISTAVETFDGSIGVTFDNDVGPFDGDGVSDAKEEVLFAKAYVDSELFHGDSGYTDNGTNFISYVERTGLAVAGVDRQGNPKVDPSVRKFLRTIYPKVSGPTNAVLMVSAGSHETPDGAITWEGPYAYTVGTDLKVDFTVNGPYLAVRFEETEGVPWKMTGYGLDIDVVSEY